MTLRWTMKLAGDLDGNDEWRATWRGCQLRLVHTEPDTYVAFVERRHVLCTGYFSGRGAFRRARAAAPLLANAMIAGQRKRLSLSRTTTNKRQLSLGREA